MNHTRHGVKVAPRGNQTAGTHTPPCAANPEAVEIDMESGRGYEEWRDIPGYVGHYQASSLGRIRSIDRYIPVKGKPAFRQGRIRKVKFHQKYLRVTLSVNGDRRGFCVHRLICETFIGAKPSSDAVIRHLDGNPLNNTPQNLRWGTAAENTADMIRHGTEYWSRRTHCKHHHEFTEANTRLVVKGHRRTRYCRECERIRSIPKNARRRAAARRVAS